ncbi:hypothetical protein P0Y35_09615 [Kiritimatiellaeota bacterium B1221]|nr:hypothetical protein [Kiritimatiellaeota bacterium B1221]
MDGTLMDFCSCEYKQAVDVMDVIDASDFQSSGILSQEAYASKEERGNEDASGATSSLDSPDDIEGSDIGGIDFVSFDSIHPPYLCHPVFKGLWKDWIVEIQKTLSEVDDSSVFEWEMGFRSDWNAEAEIIVWVGIARTFARFSEDKDQAWKIELYRFLLAVTVQDLSEAPDLLKSALMRFGRRRIGHILTRFQQERRIACRQAEEKQELKAQPSLFDLHSISRSTLPIISDRTRRTPNEPANP